MIPPTIFAGPCFVKIGTYVYYTEGDVTVALDRTTWKPNSSAFGALGSRHKSQMFKISFRPVGMLDTVAKYRPYSLSQLGALLFNNTPVYIQCIQTSDKGVYPNAAVTKAPTITASPTGSAFGDMEITSLADNTVDLLNAAAWDTWSTVAYSDTSFDETKIKSPRYTAALGSLSGIYAALQSQNGFTFEPAYELAWIDVANFGVVNAQLKDIGERCKFIPVGMDSQAYYDTLLSLQGAAGILPGMALGANAQNLVVSVGGSAPSFSLSNVGALSGRTIFSREKLRTGEIAYEGQKSWTSGVPNPLFTAAFS